MNNPETYSRVVAVGIDIQNDFTPGGSLAVPNGDLVVPTFNQVSFWTRANEGLVAYTRDWHPPRTNHFIPEGGPWPVHCVADTVGADFKTGLDVRDGDPILSKGTAVDEDAYSGFQGVTHDGMTLEGLIMPRSHEKVAVVIGGLATDYCVKATVMDALQLAEKAEAMNFERKLGVFVVQDATRAVEVEPLDGQKALMEMAEAGAEMVYASDVVSGRVLQVRN